MTINPLPGEPGIVLNLAGEGEHPTAFDINSLIFPIRGNPSRWARPGRLIRGDITELPVRDRIAVEAVGNKLPMMNDADRRLVVVEAFRVLVPGGIVRLHSSSGGGDVWLPHLDAVGFVGGTIKGGHAVGGKP